jgi:predicted RNase H-like HicB family nuclease
VSRTLYTVDCTEDVDGGWVAQVSPDPGGTNCVTQAHTLEALRSRVLEALDLCLSADALNECALEWILRPRARKETP